MVLRVFLLEDNLDLQSVIKSLLESFDYEVITFSCGEDANEYILKNGLDSQIYIIDIHLPRFNGLDILKTIRNNKASDDIFVIVISGYHDIEMIEEAYRCGSNDFLKKPFHAKELLLKIQQHYEGFTHIVRLKNGMMYNFLTKELFYFNKLINTTPKESLLMQLLLKSIPYYVSHNDIEEYVYDGDTMNSNAIRALVQRVRTKLGKDIIQNRSGLGYYIPDDKVFSKY